MSFGDERASSPRSRRDSSSSSSSDDDDDDDILDAVRRARQRLNSSPSTSSRPKAPSYTPSDAQKKYSDLSYGVQTTVRDFMLELVPRELDGFIHCRVDVGGDTDFVCVNEISGKTWMSCAKRRDGMKRLKRSVHFSLVVDPALAVEFDEVKGTDTSSTRFGDRLNVVGRANSEEDDDADGKKKEGTSLSQMMRELEDAYDLLHATNESSNDVVKTKAMRETNPLRLGKLHGDLTAMDYVLWGTGTSARKAVGAMSARPECAHVRFDLSETKIYVPASAEALRRPMKRSERLTRRYKRNDNVLQCVGVERVVSHELRHDAKVIDSKANLCVYAVDANERKVLVLRVLRTGQTTYALDFRHPFSPFSAFAVAVAVLDARPKTTAKTLVGRSSSLRNMVLKKTSSFGPSSAPSLQRKRNSKDNLLA